MKCLETEFDLVAVWFEGVIVFPPMDISHPGTVQPLRDAEDQIIPPTVLKKREGRKDYY